MARSKTNLSIKTRNARRMAEIRKQWTPEQIQVARQKTAAHKAAKRAAESPEETEARRRKNARARRERRCQQKNKEKLLRINAVLEAKQNELLLNKKIVKQQKRAEDKQIKNAEKHLALGQIEVEKLTKQMQQQTAVIGEKYKIWDEHNSNSVVKLKAKTFPVKPIDVNEQSALKEVPTESQNHSVIEVM